MNKRVGILGWLWICLLLPIQATAALPSLTVLDPISERPIAGVQVQVWTGSRPMLPEETTSGPSLLFEGQTDVMGNISLPADLPSDAQIRLQHRAFEPLVLTLYELDQREGRIYLEARSYQGAEIVFTATRQATSSDRIPHQISVIDRSAAEALNPQTMAELLGQQGFVFVQKSQLGGGSPNLRGFEANKVLLVVDGVRMNNAIYRSGHLQNIITVDPNILARTEVMFGSGAVIYGSDALGGVVHMYTRDPIMGTQEQQHRSGHYSFRLGTVNRERQVHVDLSLGGKKWASLSSITLADFGSLRMGRWRPSYPAWGVRDSMIIRANGRDSIVSTADPSLQAPSGYQQLHALQKIRFKPSRRHIHQLNVQFATTTDLPRYDRLTQTREGRLRFAEWYYGPQRRLMTAYTFEDKGNTALYDGLKLTAAYQDIRESRHDRRRGSDWLEHQRERVQVATLNLDLHKQFGLRHRLSYGLEGRYNRVGSHAEAEHIGTSETEALFSRYPAGGTDLWAGAAYATYYLYLNAAWTMQAGTRLSYQYLNSRLAGARLLSLPFAEITQSHLAPSANLGINWTISPRWRMSGLIGTGFRAPNLDDLAKVFDSQPGNVLVPNPNLRPEYTYQVESSIHFSLPHRLTLSLTGFATWYDQAIVIRDFPDYGQDSIRYEGVMSNIQANVNAREAWLAGGNFAGKWTPGQFWLGANVSYVQGRVPAEQTQLDHIPPLYGQLEAGYEAGPWRITVMLPFQAWKRLDPNRSVPPFDDPRDLANQDFATEDGWPAWWTLDIKGQYRVGSFLTVQTGIENVFDLHYRPYSSRISAPGRNLYIALRGEF